MYKKEAREIALALSAARAEAELTEEQAAIVAKHVADVVEARSGEKFDRRDFLIYALSEVL
jgi:hypothetical protein